MMNTEIRWTGLREQMRSLFTRSSRALTQAEIITSLEQKMGQPVDRVTIYRNLKLFEKAGVIHKISENQYALCEHKCHQHGHVLLHCQSCHRHMEVDNHNSVKELQKVLKKMHFFAAIDTPLHIHGICGRCQ